VLHSSAKESFGMPRTFTGFVPPLFVALALLRSGEAVADLPERASGRTVLDEVAEGLRLYRMARTPETRVAWLERLAPTHDPRVALALAEAARCIKDPVRGKACDLLIEHFVRAVEVSDWWMKNEADLHRRAAQLPGSRPPR
jgi:hypothetical protein